MEGLFVVPQFDGFDNIWIDVSDCVSREEADRIYAEHTCNGTTKTSFNGGIDYYKIFPADTRMHFSSEGYAARGEVPPRQE